MNQDPSPSPAPSAGRSPLAAALLNLSGLSAGYVYLKLWWRAAAHLAATVVLVAVANAAGGAAIPVVLLGLWLAWMVWDAWRQARRRWVGWTFTGRDTWTWPVLAAGVLLVAVAVAFTQYRAAADRALTAALEAGRAGDCEAAMDGYARVTDRFALTFSPAVATADANHEECAGLLRAEAAAEGDFQTLVFVYRDYQRDHPDGLLTAAISSRMLETFHAWAESLRGEGDYEEAVRIYERAAKEFPAEPLDDEITATLAEAAESRVRTFDARARDGIVNEALDGYVEVSREYPDTPAGQRTRQALAGFNEASQALGASEPCEQRRVARWFTEAGEPVPPPAAEQARVAIPQLTYDCGAALLEQGSHERALGLLEQVAEAGGPLAEQARALARQAEVGYVQEQVADISDSSFGIPPAERAGSAPGGTVLLEVFNGSADEELLVFLSGPTTIEVEVPACPGCVCDAPLFGQGVTVELAPGSYEVAMGRPEYLDPDPNDNVIRGLPRGFSGTWELAGGTRYWTGLCQS